jgi:homoprotocatechuate degradation regulator HpaR
MRPLDQSLPLKLLKAREAVMERFRPHLHAYGVTEQQWRVLRALAEHGELDAGKLARLVTLKMPSVSRILNDLEERALIVKSRSETDKRLVNVSISVEGANLFENMAKGSQELYVGIESVIGKEAYFLLMHQLDNLLIALKGSKS